MRIVRVSIERFGTLQGVDLPIASGGSIARSATDASPIAKLTKPARGAKRKPLAETPSLFGDAPTIAEPAAPASRAVGAGMSFVYGPNEAGKTTLLRALRYLLLGDDKVSAKRGSAREESPSVRGVVELATGSSLEIARRKGKPDWTARMRDGAEVDHEWFMGALGSPDPSLFRNVFAFSLDELARGAAALDKGEKLANQLFGSGLGGGIHPSEVMDQLRDAAAALFKPTGSAVPINAKLTELDRLKADLRQATTGSDELARLEAAVSEQAGRVDEARARTREIEAERAKLAALTQALEPYAEWQAARRERSALGDVPALPEGALARIDRARTTIERTENELARERAQAPHFEDALAEATFDARLIAAATDIEALDRTVPGYVSARAALPEQTEDKTRAEARASRRLADLGVTLSIDELRALTVPAGARERVAAAEARLAALDGEAREASALLRTMDEERARIADDEAALAGAEGGELTREEVADLTSWLDASVEHAVLTSRLATLESDARRAARAEELIRSRLDPFPTGADPATLPVPRTEEVDAFERYFADHDEALRSALAELRRTEQEVDGARVELAEIHGGADVPTEAALAHARAERDATLGRVSEAARGGPSDDLTREVRALGPAVSSADALVDRMRARADVVQRRALKEAQLAELEVRLERHHAAHGRAAAAREAAFSEWTALWADAGVTPKLPAAMRAWLHDRAQWIDAAEKLREIRAERSAQAARLDAIVDRGRAVLYASRAGEPSRTKPGSLGELRGEAERRLARDRSARDRKESLLTRRARAEATATRAETRLREIEKERAIARAAFEEAWAATGLGAAGVATVALIDELVRLRDALVAEDAQRESRIRELTALAGDTEARLAGVLARLGRSAAGRPLDVEAEALKRELTEARAAASRADEARRELARIERARARLAEERAEAERDLETLRAAAGAHGLDDLRAVAERAARAAALEHAIAAAERAALRALGHATMAELEALLAASTKETLEAEARALTERRDAAAHAYDEALRAHTSLVARREALDGSARAAERLSDIASVRAALHADVETYATLALARAVLERGVERFEREHQPELVAEASRLFAEMTEGRYVRIRTSARRDVLLVEDAAGMVRAPEQLSTGTSEQLFFALRLAYVALYIQRSEPLPVVLDDVLVNFDRARTAATLRALATLADRTQILFFTCHQHLVELVRATLPGAAIVELGA